MRCRLPMVERTINVDGCWRRFADYDFVPDRHGRARVEVIAVCGFFSSIARCGFVAAGCLIVGMICGVVGAEEAANSNAAAAKGNAGDSQSAPYQPTVAAASDEGQRAIATFRVPEGFKVELFAAEPLVANPVAFCFDEKGRMFVAETFRQEKGVEDNRHHMDWLDDDLAAQTVEDRLAFFKKHLGSGIEDFTKEHDRIRLLEDRSSKGQVDASTVFADGFNGILEGTGAGVLAWRGDVFYTCIPNLWRLRDTKGTGRADQRDAMHSGFGVRVAFRGHDMHGLVIGPDGKLYFSIGDRGLNVKLSGGKNLVNVESGSVLRCNLDGSDLEIVATGLRNPQELAFDDYGNLFTCDNNSDSGDKARWIYIVEGADYGWRMAYQYLADRGPYNREKLWYPPFPGQAAYIVPAVANVADGPSGLTYYPGVGLPERYKNTFFLADFRGAAVNSGIHAVRVKPKGAGFELASDDKFLWSILATDVDFGPDCALYVSDWVEGWTGAGKGRIYRVFDSSTTGAAVEEVKKLLAGDWSKLSTDELLKLLEHADRRVRQEAQFELADRHAAKELSAVAVHSKDQLARIHALWALGQMGVQWNQTEAFLSLLKLLEDDDAEIRAQAVKVLDGFHTLDIVDPKLIALLSDPSPRVRFFAALACAKRKRPQATEPLVAMLKENNDADPWLRHAGVMGLVGCAKVSDLLSLAKHASPSVRLAAVVALRRLEHPAVRTFLEDSDRLVGLEAARAIYDVPIPEAMPRLARLAFPINIRYPKAREEAQGATNEELSDAFTRRVIDANFRLGGENRAVLLAEASAFRSRDVVPEAMAADILEMLADWAHPSGRDRLLGMWRPIQARDAQEATTAAGIVVQSILHADKPPKQLLLKAIQLAGQFQMHDLPLQEIVLNNQEPAAIRVEAIRAVAAIDPAQVSSFLKTTLADREPLVRAESRRLLAKLKPDEALAELQKAIETGTLVERQQALAALEEAKIPGAEKAIESAMDQLLAGKLPLEVRLDVLEAAEKRGTPRLKEQLIQYQMGRSQHDELAEYREALAGGDAALGEKLFLDSAELSCRRCHNVAGRGGAVGPDLTSISAKLAAQFSGQVATGAADDLPDRKVREYLLESIVLPNKTIAKGFETVIAVTDDGRQFSGIFQSEDAKELRLLSPEGKPIVVPKSSIEVRKNGPSAMPADLIKHMTKRQLRDLVEFLVGLKAPLAPSASQTEAATAPEGITTQPAK